MEHGGWTFELNWCDASSIAYGVAIVKDSEKIEDGAWTRKKNDGTHINLAELNAVVKGVNMVKGIVTAVNNHFNFDVWCSAACWRPKKKEEFRARLYSNIKRESSEPQPQEKVKSKEEA
ncbi:unnamed protein product [Lepeophtheirus salmonis]|uniref:(salmon louse) hypothetical protein n=1 Tax=Lepeophtheirus salmonis TaxID=72036 RepID=A0A7R8HBU9_LEPSM|nr:unnamed protein product [Lepeophtheirus salmonis]CAF3001462.1 unnamed protein product [Lepeophtheirus salmonis]